MYLHITATFQCINFAYFLEINKCLLDTDCLLSKRWPKRQDLLYFFKSDLLYFFKSAITVKDSFAAFLKSAITVNRVC